MSDQESGSRVDLAVARAVAQAAAAHPQLGRVTEFRAELLARILAQPDGPAVLERLHVSDLFVAWACARRDPAAMAFVDSTLLPTVRGLLARAGVADGDIDEALQVVRVRVLPVEDGATAKIADYDGRGSLLAWLRVAAWRTASNVRRDRQGEARRDRASGEPPLADIDPELMVIRRQFGALFQNALRDAFAKLEAAERTLFRLHYVDGLNIDRIAIVLGVSRATVGRRMLASRQRLVDDVLRGVTAELRVDATEMQSILRAVRSGLHVSIGALVREGIE